MAAAAALVLFNAGVSGSSTCGMGKGLNGAAGAKQGVEQETEKDQPKLGRGCGVKRHSERFEWRGQSEAGGAAERAVGLKLGRGMRCN